MAAKSRAFSRYRPRLLTLVLVAVAAAPVVVANLSRDQVRPQVWPPPSPKVWPPALSYGWPLIWYWCEFKTSSALTPPSVLPSSIDTELVRWSGSRLAANLTVWLAVIAVAALACEWLLRCYAPRWRRRPRVVTLIVLMFVAAPIVLANLSPDEESSTYVLPWNSWVPQIKPWYGWPLIWRWRNVQYGYGGGGAFDQNYSTARLTGNLARARLLPRT